MDMRVKMEAALRVFEIDGAGKRKKGFRGTAFGRKQVYIRD